MVGAGERSVVAIDTVITCEGNVLGTSTSLEVADIFSSSVVVTALVAWLVLVEIRGLDPLLDEIEF